MRIDGRKNDELRPVKLTPGFSRFAEGSCLIEMGNTMVLCCASVEERVPPHVVSGGWITAEYSLSLIHILDKRLGTGPVNQSRDAG